MSSDPLNQNHSTDQPPSKSQRKRDAQAVLELARKIVELSAGKLEKLPLDDDLRRVAAGAQGITRRVARKREIQYFAKCLREIDCEPIEAALAELAAPGLAESRRHHRLEAWRERLISESDQTAFDLLADRADVDFQAFRQLLRVARKAREADKDHRAFRQIYRRLADLDRASPLPDPHD